MGSTRQVQTAKRNSRIVDSPGENYAKPNGNNEGFSVSPDLNSVSGLILLHSSHIHYAHVNFVLFVVTVCIYYVT